MIRLNAARAGIPRPLPTFSPVAEATPAERPGMPAGRAVVHRAAAAIGTAVPAGPTTAGDADGVTRDGLVERGQRHRRRRRDRRKAEANRKRRRKKHFHGYFPFLTNMPRRGGGAWTQNIVAAWQQEAPVTSDGGAHGASE